MAKRKKNQAEKFDAGAEGTALEQLGDVDPAAAAELMGTDSPPELPKGKKGKGTTKGKTTTPAPEPESTPAPAELDHSAAKEPTKAGKRAEARAKVLAALHNLKAFSRRDALPLERLAVETGIDRKGVYTAIAGGSGKVGSEPSCLLATGLVLLVKVEGLKGQCAHLTKKARGDE